MNLFFKIFLWFLAAISLMVGIVVFLNWTSQTEPAGSRWQASVRNQMTVFAGTATQIYESEGEPGLRKFLERVDALDTVTHLDMVDENSKFWLTDGQTTGNYHPIVTSAFTSGNVELELGSPETALAAKSFAIGNGQKYVLVVRWDRPRATPFFGEAGPRYLRFGVLLLAALALCYALARYLSSPIGKLREATKKFAGGDLKTRVAGKLGNRHDELGALARDFDDMVERIESLVTSQQRLTRDISHELRSPLSRMNVALEIAKQKSGNGNTPVLERIENESKRLNEMISQILTLSKLESGTQVIEKHPIDLNGLLDQIVSDANFEAGAKGKAVKVVNSGECIIYGNENLLRSAIENVLRNAVRYTNDGTVIEVTLDSNDDNARLRVRDYGSGVPETELENLFRPFYRVGEARERKTGGSGLGLAIAEQAIYAHKGSIKARNVNNGLEVEIELNCGDSPIAFTSSARKSLD